VQENADVIRSSSHGYSQGGDDHHEDEAWLGNGASFLQARRAMFRVSVMGGIGDVEQARDFTAFSDAEIFARKFVQENDAGSTAKWCQILHDGTLAATVRIDGVGEVWTDVESTHAPLI
jgi:hypothetical protein